jgi:hypothetical protein
MHRAVGGDAQSPSPADHGNFFVHDCGHGRMQRNGTVSSDTGGDTCEQGGGEQGGVWVSAHTCACSAICIGRASSSHASSPRRYASLSAAKMSRHAVHLFVASARPSWKAHKEAPKGCTRTASQAAIDRSLVCKASYSMYRETCVYVCGALTALSVRSPPPLLALNTPGTPRT